MKIPKYIIGLGIVLMFSLSTVWPFVQPGYFTMHDDTQVARVVVMGKALLNGQFPVRWVSDLGYGYGYPIFNFYGPFPYYVGGSLYALGFNGLLATKIMMVAGMLLAGITIYVLLATHVGVVSGIVGAIFYVYFPYHAVQMYVRGAVGELWFMAFFPLFMYGIWSQITNYQIKKGIFIGGLGLAGMIMSHTLLGYATVTISIVFYVYFMVYLYVKTKLKIQKVLPQMYLLAIGLGLSAFFWLPAIGEMQYTNVAGQISATADYHEHYLCLPQLWDSSWGYGGSVPGCIDGMSFRLGKIHIIIFILSIFLGAISKKAKDYKLLFLFGLGITMLGLFLVLPISKFVWKILPLFAFMQYPWRFLIYIGFGMSTVIGIGAKFYSKRFNFFWVVILFLSVMVYKKLFIPQQIYIEKNEIFETTEELRFRASKISDEYLPKELKKPNSFIDVPKAIVQSPSDSIVEPIIERDTYHLLFITLDKPQILKLNIASFPGWEIKVNGQKQISKVIYGLLQVALPQGRSSIELKFVDTPIRKIANLVSTVTVLMLLFIYGKKTYT